MKEGLISQLARAFGSHGSLAAAAGVKHAAVSQWKRRQRIPLARMARIVLVAEAEGITLPDGFHAMSSIDDA